MNSLARLDVIVLALMALYSFAVVVHVYVHLARAQTVDSVSRRTLAVLLNTKVDSLKSIALTAPYLGLAGTCVGILSGFGAVAMEKHTALLLITTRMGLSIIPTVVGIPVAVLATGSYNYLRTRIDSLENEVLEEVALRARHFRGASRFPATKLFSKLPAFGLIAAPTLAVLITGYMSFASFHTPKGLAVELASTRCEHDGDDRLIVLHITDTGKVFLNQEEEDWSSLADHLSQIYRMREHRTLYLLADPGVPFQTVADAIDSVEKERLDIRVRLVTPKAFNANCVEPVAVGSAHRVFR